MQSETVSASATAGDGISGQIRSVRSRNIADTLRLQAGRSPEKTALVFEDRRDNFAELNRLVDRAANALLAAGIHKGDRVAFFSHNNRSFVILRYAVLRIGAIFTPINFMLNAQEVSFILDHSGARAILAEDALCQVADEAFGKLQAPPVFRAFLKHSGASVPKDWTDGDALSEFADDTPVRVVMDEDDPAQLMYTSGTESQPKGALLSSRALLAQYITCIIDGGMTSEDIELHAMPLYHCAQLDCFLSVDLYLGATSILVRSPDPAMMLEIIARERVTKLFCPPTVWISLLRHPDFERHDLSCLRKGYYGASIMPTPIIEEILKRLPGIGLWNFYGQTEIAPLATILKPEDQLRKLGSAGLPGLNVETRIVDDNDQDVPTDAIGEIIHRSPQAMLGYYKDEAKTAEMFRNGWLHSGDLGRMDDEGYIYVVDRKKDMIKSGGENVASREVEEVLFKHGKIAEVAVFGLPDDRWIEAVTAVVVPRDGENVTVEELETYCRERLAGYKRPKRLYIETSLPKNASGKILKRELRLRYVGCAGDG